MGRAWARTSWGEVERRTQTQDGSQVKLDGREKVKRMDSCEKEKQPSTQAGV